jgi:hypothetical protein
MEDERELLRRFVDGKKVEDQEYDTLQSYSTIGVVRMGVSFKKREVQASLTESGKALLGLEKSAK